MYVKTFWNLQITVYMGDRCQWKLMEKICMWCVASITMAYTRIECYAFHVWSLLNLGLYLIFTAGQRTQGIKGDKTLFNADKKTEAKWSSAKAKERSWSPGQPLCRWENEACLKDLVFVPHPLLSLSREKIWQAPHRRCCRNQKIRKWTEQHDRVVRSWTLALGSSSPSD